MHKLKGEEVWLNPDLIASVESVHTENDTLLTLTDGRQFVIADSPAVVAEQVRVDRARVLALAFQLYDDPASLSRHLHAVPDEGD